MRELVEELKALRESSSAQKIAADILALVPQKRHDVISDMLKQVLDAYYDNADLYNQEYKSAKSWINTALDETYRERCSKPFTWGKGGQNAESILSWQVNMSLVGLNATAKKLDKYAAKPDKPMDSKSGTSFSWNDLDPAFVKEIQEIVYAFLPIAKILKELKSKVKMGRKPASPEQQAKKAAQLAKKDMKTCACCFRTIARLKNGRIADHGYSLKGWGMRIGSCPGRSFKPLEVSNEGTKHMEKRTKEVIQAIQKDIREAPNKTKLAVQVYGSSKPKIITPEDPHWKIKLGNYMMNLKSELKQAERSLKHLQQVLRTWKKTAD